MIEKFNFNFNELVIDQLSIKAALGYQDSNIPPPFDAYLEDAMVYAQNLSDIRACYRILNDIEADEKCRTIKAGGQEFKIGKTVCNELKGSKNLAFFICTAGKTISEKSSRLLKGEDIVLGYVYDVLGSAIVEAAADKMQSYLKQKAELEGEQITNRYSPGYCNWSVADQHKLFSLFGDGPVGVRLTDSALMLPVKSVSGIIGIGKEVKFRDYQCTLCLSENCVYRNLSVKKR